mgnify:CR=1 FL=1
MKYTFTICVGHVWIVIGYFLFRKIDFSWIVIGIQNVLLTMMSSHINQIDPNPSSRSTIQVFNII